MSLVVILVLAVASVIDLRSRRVPDWIPVCLAVLAGVSLLAQQALAAWPLLLWGALLGAAIGTAAFTLGAMGGGDVKLLTGLGLACGAPLLASTLFYTALAGGALAVVAATLGRREIPYVPAIGAGFAAAVWRAGAW